MPSLAELAGLLTLPNESMNVEYKSWLDLSENPDRAKLAKAAIALANHGGGIIVLGMRPDNVDGGALGSHPRPNELRRYSQDQVNAAINRYAEPHIHCELSFANHPQTDVEHAFVSVPSGIAVPVMSTRACQGVITAQRCYIRKPGPRSEEPYTAEEWRSLLGRCLRAGREDMLGAIRLIVQGRAGDTVEIEARAALDRFFEDSRRRWQDRIDALPANDVGRLPFGHYELGAEILDVPPARSLVEMRQRMNKAGEINLTGWGPFVMLTGRPPETGIIEGAIETWLGAPGERPEFRVPKYCDFWRALRDGKLFLIRGYDEDSIREIEPGTCTDLAIPILRIGEAMIYIARLSHLFDDNPTIVFRCRYVGLQNRLLTSVYGSRIIRGGRVCVDDEISMEINTNADQIDDNIVEILYTLLQPFYELFSFFDIPMAIITEEIDRMRRNRF